ncbi:MAG TPA: hypothetical protein VF549_11045 [Solirubrobacteraceae bacterium]
MKRPFALVASLALALTLALAPGAFAQEDEPPVASQNQFFLHGTKLGGPTIDKTAPTGDVPNEQDTEPIANEDSPENPLAAYWTQQDAGLLAPAAVNGKQAVFRWFWTSPNATGVVVGVGVSVTIFAIPTSGDPRVIGRVDEVSLLVGGVPTLNETIVPITGTLAAGERVSVQVVPVFIDTGPGLTAVYDSADFPSGFSLRTPPPESAPAGVDGLASAPANGLAFSATLPADPQRDESEPNIEIDNDGNIYTCGPSGASQGVDYAQVSRDGGNQFHLMGEPPRGQQALGGGGDCGLATAPERNAAGNFTYAYSGLGPLTNFATASSQDVGRTMRSSPSSQSIPGVDRQWHTFVDADSVLLSYNQQQPRQVVVQRSDDGGVNYAPSKPATSTNPGFPGPMHTLPASLNPDGAAAGRVPYFSWHRDNQVFLAVSTDEGDTWHNCKIAAAPGEPSLFTTSDNDEAGNIYIAYAENKSFHTYVSVLKIGNLDTCLAAGSEVNPVNGAQTESTEVQATVEPPIQMDRDAVRTTVFAWIAAGGKPGRIAVSYYGSETDGDPNVGPGEDDDGKPIGFRGSWDVYVSQTLNALSATPDVAQVKATTHPFHYDSICLNGTACILTQGDRSLADFFALDFNRVRHTLHLVYNQGYKRPDDAAGVLATPAVLNQIGGPTLDGETIDPAQGPALANARDDAKGDAITDYSRTCPQSDPTPCPDKPAAGKAQPGPDLLSVKVGPERDVDSGAAVSGGGFNVTLKVADLSDAALQQALDDQRATNLLFVFRWINGFRSAAAVARWSPDDGFRFGFNDFVTTSVSCGANQTCLTYPGDQEIQGKVSQADGTIELRVPRSKLKALEGPTGKDQRPKEVPAGDDSRFYDATAFVLASTVPADQPEQSFLYPFDNAPSFDFLTGGKLPADAKQEQAPPPVEQVPPPAPPPSGPAPTACTASRVLRSAGARGDGRGVRLSFTGVTRLASRSRTDRVDVDVFKTSRGRRVVGPLLVARFRDRSRSFTWDGKANRKRRNVGDGYYFVRYRVGGDVRRVTLRRRHGRWTRRPTFHRARSCRVLQLFKLRRPAFGGVDRRNLGIAYRLTEPGTVTVTVLRGKRVVKRYPARPVPSGRVVRLNLSADPLRRGDYRVRLRVRATSTVTATLTSHRL